MGDLNCRQISARIDLLCSWAISLKPDSFRFFSISASDKPMERSTENSFSASAAPLANQLEVEIRDPCLSILFHRVTE